MDARYDYASVRPQWVNGLAERPTSLWRYAELLPVEGPDPDISLYEGFTPLIRLYHYERMFAHPHIYIKDERQGPTSSFKDRQAAVAVTALKQAGIKECVLASTGNAGAAYAAYCARAGIKLWLFLTHVVPSEKMREAALYGAEVVKVSGTYDEAKKVAAEFARQKNIHFDLGARAVPGKESMKTLGFEIAEQLGLAFDGAAGHWVAPDWYVQAVSGGIGPLGVWKGFEELYQMGLVDKMPRLGIIQAAGCAPMVQAFAAGSAQADPVTPRTLIHVLATGNPGLSYVKLREAVLSNDGAMIAVEDGETFAAMRRLASTAGLSVEPATAVAFAGLERLLYDGIIELGETVVVNCSGHTFPAESHVLGDQYLLNLELDAQAKHAESSDGLAAALQSLDEQVTTVLVVDDNADDRRLMRRLLRAHKNYRVFEASSGREALKVMEEHLPDLIISDLSMPEMDGMTLIEQIKWNPDTAHIPVVVVSAKSLTPQDMTLLDRYTESVWSKGE
ncbi:MAG: pyridoxal-phosphate dependent enzyme, partial [Anaerolineae bacterium]|nr:pyridoxal-phosphate dependent enzyme [Anaerolineae bacterium]